MAKSAVLQVSPFKTDKKNDKLRTSGVKATTSEAGIAPYNSASVKEEK